MYIKYRIYIIYMIIYEYIWIIYELYIVHIIMCACARARTCDYLDFSKHWYVRLSFSDIADKEKKKKPPEQCGEWIHNRQKTEISSYNGGRDVCVIWTCNAWHLKRLLLFKFNRLRESYCRSVQLNSLYDPSILISLNENLRFERSAFSPTFRESAKGRRRRGGGEKEKECFVGFAAVSIGRSLYHFSM